MKRISTIIIILLIGFTIYLFLTKESNRYPLLSEVIETLGKDGYFNDPVNLTNRIGWGFITTNYDGDELAISKHGNSKENKTRYLLASLDFPVKDRVVFDSVDIDNAWSYCYKEGNYEKDYVLVSYEGDLNSDYTIISAWGVDYRNKKFIEINPSEVKCFSEA